MTFYPTGGCRRCCELVWPGAGVGGEGGSVMKALGWLADKPRVQSLPFLGAFLLTLLMPENWCCWCSSLRGESRTEKWPTKNIHFLQFSPWQFIGYIPTRFYDRPSTTVNFFSFDSLEDVHEVRIWTDWQSRDWHVTWQKVNTSSRTSQGNGRDRVKGGCVSQYTSWSEDFRNVQTFPVAGFKWFCLYLLFIQWKYFICLLLLWIRAVQVTATSVRPFQTHLHSSTEKSTLFHILLLQKSLSSFISFLFYFCSQWK